jgi:hypothetical protein
MKLEHVCALSALLVSMTVPTAIAQTATPSPSTPPTHPTLRENPTTAPDSASGAARTKRNATVDEAKQACKNMSGEMAQRECMKKAESDSKKGSRSASMPSP